MEKKNFSDFVESLAYHFGQDKFVQPGNTTALRLRSWFEQICNLPDDPLPWMGSVIKKRFNYFPRNLSKTMLELWEEWQKYNPEKVSENEECPYCADGWILADSPELPFPSAVRCGHCSPVGSGEGFWQATHLQIRRRGWSVCLPADHKEDF
ncbi:MAG: hypothetical protein ACLFQG_01275 [Desulfovermiculus sp.]